MISDINKNKVLGHCKIAVGSLLIFIVLATIKDSNLLSVLGMVFFGVMCLASTHNAASFALGLKDADVKEQDKSNTNL